MLCEGMVQMQSETGILRLGKWKHIPLISVRKTIKEFSAVWMDGHNSLVLCLHLFFHDSINEDYSYLHEFPWGK